MKKFTALAAVCAALISVLSCNKEEQTEVIEIKDPVQEEVEAQGLEYVTFTAGKEELDPETRSHFSDDALNWDSSETIRVFDDGYGDAHDFSLQSGGGTASAKFSGGVCPGSINLYAVSPASAAASSKLDISEGKISVTVLSSQKLSSATAGYADSGALVTVAKMTRDRGSAWTALTGVTFKNVCSFIRFSVTNSDVSSITISSLNGEDIAGTVPITWCDGDPELGTVSPGSKSITITPPAGNFTADRVYIIPVLAKKSLGGVNFKFTRGGTEYFGRKTFSTALSRSKGVTIGNIDAHGSPDGVELTATTAGKTQINLSWTSKSASGMPVKYQIRRSEVGGTAEGSGSAAVATTDLGASSYNVTTGLTAGTAYTFWIRALDGNGNPISAWGSANQMTKLNVPTGVTTQGLTATSYEVNFTKPSGATGVNITTSSPDATVSNVTTSPKTINTTTVYTDVTKRNITGITVRVVATNADYPQANSDPVVIATARCGYFSGGAGTSASPFIISNAGDLKDLMDWTQDSYRYPLSGTNAGNPGASESPESALATGVEFRSSYYKQTADITWPTYSASSPYYTNTVGSNHYYNHSIGYSRGYWSFKGVYDGNSKTVSGYCNYSSNYSALFAVLDAENTEGKGIVKNLYCKDIQVYSYNFDWTTPLGGMAAIVGYAYRGATITGCKYTRSSQSTLEFNCAKAGAIVGWLDASTLSNCTVGADGTALTIKMNTVAQSDDAGEFCGGVVGLAENSASISNCSIRNCTVQSPYDKLGGIAGKVLSSTITGCNCYTATVTMSSLLSSYISIGGIAGTAESSTISSCYFRNGTISYTAATSKGGLGGIVGKGGDVTIENCQIANGGTVSIQNNSGDLVGGIIGQVYAINDNMGFLQNCQIYTNNTVYIKGYCMVGGIVGGYNVENATASSNPVLHLYKCRTAGGNITVEGLEAGVGLIIGGARDAMDIPNGKKYTLKIDRCYTQAGPHIKAGTKSGSAQTSGYGSGTAAILGRPAVRANGTNIYITNCIVGSAQIYENWHDAGDKHVGLHVGGLIGYLKADDGTTPGFTCYCFNNAVYGFQVWLPKDENLSAAIAGLIGHVNGSSSQRDELRLYTNVTNFTYGGIYTAKTTAGIFDTDVENHSSDVVKYTTDAPTSGMICSVIGRINASDFGAGSGLPEPLKVRYNVFQSSWKWYTNNATVNSDILHKDGDDYDRFNPYSGTNYNNSKDDIDYLNGINYDPKYKTLFNAVMWNYKTSWNGTPTSTEEDERAYIHWDQTTTRW